MTGPLTMKYACTCLEYKTPGIFKRHLIEEHNWIIDVLMKDQLQSKTDLIALYRASFMKKAHIMHFEWEMETEY